MNYAERINTYILRLSAVPNAKFEKKRLSDIVARLLKPNYPLTAAEAAWINRNCKIWLGADTGFTAGYRLTSRQRQTLRANWAQITSNVTTAAKANVAANVAKPGANVTGNVAGSPANVTANVAATTLKPAHSLGSAPPIVNNVILNSLYSQYAPPSACASADDVADKSTDAPPASIIDVADAKLDGSAGIDAGYATSSLDVFDAAKATSGSTLGASAMASATSGLDQDERQHIAVSPRTSVQPVNDNGHVGQNQIEKGREAQQPGAAQADGIDVLIQANPAILLNATKTVQTSIWTDRMPMGKGEICFGKQRTYVQFQSAATHGAAVLDRINGDTDWERDAGEMFKTLAAGGGGVSAIYLDATFQKPIKNAFAMMFYDGGKPQMVMVDLPGWCERIVLNVQPRRSKGPQYKGAWKAPQQASA